MNADVSKMQRSVTFEDIPRQAYEPASCEPKQREFGEDEGSDIEAEYYSGRPHPEFSCEAPKKCTGI